MKNIAGNVGYIATLILAGAFVWATAACDSSEPSGDETLDGGVEGYPDSGIQPPDQPEPCNEVDDDGDGRVDEGCACVKNSTQACWPGDPAARNVGECRDGIQHCIGETEMSQWGPCEGYVLPSEDIPDDGIDQNCDGGDGDFCVPTGPEICNNDMDDDCDGDTDCRDSDCEDYPLCSGDCVPEPEICDDMIDNDCDMLIDCDDIQDCATDPWACTCIKMCPPGEVRWCDDPTYCRWGSQVCNPDGTWGACVETANRPAGCEDKPFYDPICCVMAGECCQALPSNDSIGDCPPMEIVCDPI